jgi:serine/threonine protein phosphatase 1
MIRRFRNYLSPRLRAAAPAVPPGERVYAIGDIHGRLDLFSEMIERIEEDDARRGPASTTVVLLGDLIDRGPDSAGVIDAARAWAQRRPLRVLAGNHEEMFLKSFDKAETLRHFLRFGGRETLLSYPIGLAEYQSLSLEELQQRMPQIVPAEHVAYLESLEDSVTIGDYLFVHAGIRPGVPLADQSQSDLRWIREMFIEDSRDHGCIVVHGHTICDDVEEMPNRIGIDTGAYKSGRLTCLALEGDQRWYITASASNGARGSTAGRDAA